MPVLTPDQVAAFNRDGYLLVQGAIPDAAFTPVIDEISAWVDHRAQQLLAAGDITDLHDDLPFTRRYGQLFAQSRKMARGLDIMHMLSPALFDFLANPDLLDVVGSLLGPELTCNPIQHLRAKPPGRYEEHQGPSFHNAAWHQDAGVMMVEAEASQIITCWLPLAQSTQELGCLQVLPGFGDAGYLAHVRAGETTLAEVPDVAPVQLPCERGDVILMSRFTPHCSGPNKGDECRWSLDLRYQVTGQHTGRTAHPDHIVRSAADPGSVMNDYEVWRDVWQDALQNPRGFAGHRIDQ